jgi:hypothetical protein
MPIRRYVEKGVFTPQALSAMSKALEATTEILRIEGDEAKRQAVARFIIRLSREDNSLDAAEMRDKAVAALGGVAYLAIVPYSARIPSQAQNDRRLAAQVHSSAAKTAQGRSRLPGREMASPAAPRAVASGFAQPGRGCPGPPQVHGGC